MYFTKGSKVFEFNLRTLEISQLKDSSVFKRLESLNLVFALEKSDKLVISALEKSRKIENRV